ncbi:hypothetical protein H5410_061246 [Solanum commersonii]|uniref:Uncharacterized protein n=1 Tax=Solanum commersonii TaxID=4109 RepID=A0A9J5W8K3_SOLCO|nr:hypothetical protein H5410_061246 [Solanum commersonii]
MGDRELLGVAPTAPFPRRLDLFLQGLAHWNIRRDLRPFDISPNGLGDLQAIFSSFFQPLCSFLFDSVHALSLNKTQVQQFKNDVSNSSTQNSIMNVHNKTQLIHERINLYTQRLKL